MKLKLSEYLTILPYRDNFLIFQGYTGEVVLIRKMHWQNLFSGKRLIVSPHLKKRIIELLKSSILVPAETNEVATLRSIFNDALRQDSQEGYLGLYLTLRCNFACPYCFLDEKQSDITEEIIAQSLRELFRSARKNKTKKVRISFWGGEPMLRFDRLEYAVRLGRELGEKHKIKVTFDIVSNGSLFDVRLLSLFSKPKDLDHIQTTLDGPQQVHDGRRFFKGGRGSYSVIIKNLPLWMKIAKKILLRINIDKENAEHVPQLLNELSKFNKNKIKIFLGDIFKGWGRGKERKTVMSGRDYEVAESKLADLAEEMGFNVGRSVLPHYRPILCKASGACPSWIGPDGEIYCCTRVVGNQTYTIGNISRGIRKQKSKIWLNRNLIHRKHCLKCEHVFFCGGPCLAQNMIGKKGSGLCGRGFEDVIKDNIGEYIQQAKKIA